MNSSKYSDCSELEIEVARQRQQLKELTAGLAMVEGLCHIMGAGIIALLGEELTDFLNESDLLREFLAGVDDEKLMELVGKIDESLPNVITAIRKLDGMSQAAVHKRLLVLERRASTLPPFKRALFDSLKQFAQPMEAGTKLLEVLVPLLELSSTFEEQHMELLRLMAIFLDKLSDLWPLAAVNSLGSILRYVGFDDAAEAAGEILDTLDETGDVPRHLVHRVRPDLVRMGAIEARTKPSTIAQYFIEGHRLKTCGMSPDYAASYGHIPSSPTQLKRASKALEGLELLYDRVSESPADDDLKMFDALSESMRKSIDMNKVRMTAAALAKSKV